MQNVGTRYRAHKTVYLVSKLGSIVAFKTDAHTPRKTSV